jgi:hypothetical protein
MTIEIPVPFVTHRIEGPSQFVETTKSEIVGMFTQAYLMRRMEIAAGPGRTFCPLTVCSLYVSAHSPHPPSWPGHSL